jgi:O-antigen/teichoic acid export membrane protein
VAGFGVWSLVAGALARAALSAFFATLAARPPLKPLLSLRELRDLASYGVVASANGIVNYAGRRGDVFLIGRHMGETTLGLYSRAVHLTMLAINYFTNVLLSVLFPSYSQLQKDRPKLRRGFIMSVELTALVTVPLSVGMIVSAPHLIRGLYGEQWVGAVLPLQILSIGTLPRAMPSVASALSHACDRVGTELLIQVAFFVGICAAVILGAPHGLPRVAAHVTIVAVGFSLLTSWLALSITGASWRAFLVAQLPGFFVGAITAIGAVPARIGLERLGAPSAIVLLVLIVTCALGVFVGTYALPQSLRPTELFTYISRRPRWMSGVVHEQLTRVLRIPEDAGAASG